MIPSEFSRLARTYPLVESKYIPEIEQQLLSAPYCQTLHLLLAKSKRDANDSAATDYIQQAALYASDRPHLKYLLELSVKHDDSVLRSAPAKIILPVEGPGAEKKKATVMTQSQTPAAKTEIAESHSDIADVLMMDLDILKEKTKAFVELTSEKTIRKPATTAELVIETTPEIKPVPSPQIKQPKGGDENDLLLLEIKSSRKKIKPENPRKAEQIEIIDQFIKARQVTIRPPEKAMPKQDLAESADSYSENVISETLVEILVRQGKKEKAVDVLKKLIWKFPQKKHLFAARIQDLSK